jgi:probable rRNA maturation factor
MGPDDIAPRSPARRAIHVAVSDHRGRPLASGLSRWLSGVAPARAKGAVNVAIVSDARVRALNRRYRGIDRATDVLSFPAGGPAKRFLGDIVIARGIARRQARAAGHRESTEIKILALHGLLHLLGYDHERDTGAMARLERRLRRIGGLREGLLERP